MLADDEPEWQGTAPLPLPIIEPRRIAANSGDLRATWAAQAAERVAGGSPAVKTVVYGPEDRWGVGPGRLYHALKLLGKWWALRQADPCSRPGQGSVYSRVWGFSQQLLPMAAASTAVDSVFQAADCH